jgi:molybdopterin-guanine dinucleotide biosynthesis protein A
MVNANRNLDAWRAFGLPVFEDRIDGFAGPLAGLDAAMALIRTPWIMTVPCDTPALPDDLVERLAQAATSTCAEVAVARTGAQAQPVFALVRSSLHSHLTEFLATGRRRIDAWYAPLRVTEVDFSDPLAFRNLNTEQDLNDYLASRVDAPTAAPPIPRPHA